MTMNDAISNDAVLTWRADEVTDWLMNIGLEKYVERFKSKSMIVGYDQQCHYNSQIVLHYLHCHCV